MSGGEFAAIEAPCSVPGCDLDRRSNDMCVRHYYRLRRTGRLELRTTTDRFWAFVEKTDCWNWTGNLNTDGYGRFWDGENRRHVQAHRWSYEKLRSAIGPGLQIDHLCRNRRCVNPDHLEPVTPRVNTLRSTAVTAAHAAKTHCPQGHEYSAENTYRNAAGRHCRICRLEASRRHRRKKASQ